MGWTSAIRLERELCTQDRQAGDHQVRQLGGSKTLVWVLQDRQKVVVGLGSRSPVSGRQPYKLASEVFLVSICSWNKRTQKPNQIANQEVLGKDRIDKGQTLWYLSLGCKGSEEIFVTDAPGLSKNNIPLSPSLPFGLGLKFSSPWSFWPNSMSPLLPLHMLCSTAV